MEGIYAEPASSEWLMEGLSQRRSPCEKLNGGVRSFIILAAAA